MPPRPKLEYDNTLPPFLQRLKGQLPGAGEPSRIQQVRPKKELIDQEDDGPTYVDETSHETISKEIFEKMASGDRSDNGRADSYSSEAANDQKDKTAQEKVDVRTTFGTSAKRKHAKVIGGDDEADDTKSAERPETVSTETALSERKKSNKKPMGKKGKKIKLSFDDDDEEE